MAVFYNQATLSYSGGTTNSNVVTGELTEAFTAAKTAVSGTYAPGETLTYILSLVNGGAAAQDGVSVADDLGGYAFDGGTVYPLEYVENSLLYFVNGAQQPVSSLTVTGSPTLTIDGISVPADGNVMLIYEAQVTSYAPPGDGGQITNTAAVTGAGTALTAQAVVTAQAEPLLTVNKAMDPQTVSGSERLTYTFTIQNTGAAEATAADAIVLSDAFDPVLTDLTVTLGDSPAERATDYTYDETTGAFATVSGVITVPAATFTQSANGEWVTTPGVTVVTVTGTV